jgi:hypothetical protein
MTDDEFVSFMCRPHPKIGKLHLKHQDKPERDLYFTPGVGTQTIVGQIICENGNAGRAPHVRVVEFGGEAAQIRRLAERVGSEIRLVRRAILTEAEAAPFRRTFRKRSASTNFSTRLRHEWLVISFGKRADDRRPAMRSIWMPIFWTPFTHVRLHQKLTPLSPH